MRVFVSHHHGDQGWGPPPTSGVMAEYHRNPSERWGGPRWPPGKRASCVLAVTSLVSSGLQQPQALSQHGELCRSRRGQQLPAEQPHPQPPPLELAVQHAVHAGPPGPESPLCSFHEVSVPGRGATFLPRADLPGPKLAQRMVN